MILRVLTVTQLLYSLDYDKEPISTIQTLLLFSLRSTPSSKHQGPAHWVQLAVHLARQEGLHHQTTGDGLQLSCIATRRRLWWCCVVQDTLIANAECHAPSIHLFEFQCCMLEIEDFDLSTCLEMTESEEPQKGPDELVPLTEVFVEVAKLSALLNRVLWSRYEPSLVQMDSCRYVELSTALEQWRQQLPSSCQPPDPALMLRNDQASPLDVQRTVLHMTYQTTISLLRCQIPDFDVFACKGTIASGDSQMQSAQAIMRLAATLVTCELEELVPIAGVVLLLPALIAHALHASGHTIDYRTAQDAQQSIQLLERMKEKFDFADIAACHLEALRAGTNIVPAERADGNVLSQVGYGMSPDEDTLCSTAIPDLSLSLDQLDSTDFADFAELDDASPQSLDYDSSGLAFLSDTPNLT